MTPQAKDLHGFFIRDSPLTHSGNIMNRRIALRYFLLSTAAASVTGCKLRIKQVDPQPKRGLLEDRWPGYYFDTVTASYSLQLQNPASSLSRPSQLAGPRVVHQGRDISSDLNPPSVRPTWATVDLNYVAGSVDNCQVSVTIHWPNDNPSPTRRQREITETMTASVSFLDVERFINGTGEFRCDYNNHFYGPLSYKKKKREANSFDVIVDCTISGKSPDSHFKGEIRYRDGPRLYDLAGLAVDGIG